MTTQPPVTSPFTNAQKIQMYKLGQYKFPPPPVTPIRWTTTNWITYIDRFGIWTPKVHNAGTVTMKEVVKLPGIGETPHETK